MRWSLIVPVVAALSACASSPPDPSEPEPDSEVLISCEDLPQLDCGAPVLSSEGAYRLETPSAGTYKLGVAPGGVTVRSCDSGGSPPTVQDDGNLWTMELGAEEAVWVEFQEDTVAVLLGCPAGAEAGRGGVAEVGGAGRRASSGGASSGASSSSGAAPGAGSTPDDRAAERTSAEDARSAPSSGRGGSPGSALGTSARAADSALSCSRGVSIQAPEYAVPAAVDGYHHEAAVLRPTQSVLLRGLTGLVEGHEGACGAFFTVHIADDDRWTPLWRADVSVDSGCQVVESGPMVVVMEPGHDYAVGLGWDCATYTALQQKGSHHARTPLGRHRGAVGLHYASDPEWRAASCMLQPMTVEYSRLQVGGWGPALTWSSTEPADRLEVCEDSFRRSRLFMPDPSTFPRLPPPRR